MKRLFVIFLGVVLVMGFAITAAEAGTSAGKIRLGATLAGYNWRKATLDIGVEGVEPEISTSVIFLGDGAGATVGYCVNDNIEVGGNILFSLTTDKTKELYGAETEMATTDMRIATYLNYNYPVSDQLFVYPEVLFGYLNIKEENKVIDVTERVLSGFLFGGGGGLKYFPIDNVSLDLGLNFIYGMLTVERGIWENDASGLELRINAGVSLYLGGEK